MWMTTSGEGKHQVTLKTQEIGSDLLLVLTGGDQPHLGGMVMCEPGKESQSVISGTHKDYIVLQPLAEAACKKYQTTVIAVGGIHIENATKEDIDEVIKNCKELEKCI
jgi:hypothetical protein